VGDTVLELAISKGRLDVSSGGAATEEFERPAAVIAWKNTRERVRKMPAKGKTNLIGNFFNLVDQRVLRYEVVVRQSGGLGQARGPRTEEPRGRRGAGDIFVVEAHPVLLAVVQEGPPRFEALGDRVVVLAVEDQDVGPCDPTLLARCEHGLQQLGLGDDHLHAGRFEVVRQFEGSVRRVRPRKDPSASDDSQEDDRIVDLETSVSYKGRLARDEHARTYIVEAVETHAISWADSGRSKARHQFANQHSGLVGRYRPRRIGSIDIDLSGGQYSMDWNLDLKSRSQKATELVDQRRVTSSRVDLRPTYWLILIESRFVIHPRKKVFVGNRYGSFCKERHR
jgi:hypothetical protein